MPLCRYCQQNPIPPGNRVYCATCSPQASRIWKIRERRQWRAEWRERGCTGPPPCLDGWPSIEARRTYYRNYMRAWRRRRENRQQSQPRSETT